MKTPEELFPTGVWSDSKREFMVKDAQYFWPVMETGEDGVMFVTPHGKTLLQPEPDSEETLPFAASAIGNELGGELNLDDLPDLSPSKTLKKKRGLG